MSDNSEDRGAVAIVLLLLVIVVAGMLISVATVAVLAIGATGSIFGAIHAAGSYYQAFRKNVRYE